jgi:hypothetical protein
LKCLVAPVFSVVSENFSQNVWQEYAVSFFRCGILTVLVPEQLHQDLAIALLALHQPVDIGLQVGSTLLPAALAVGLEQFDAFFLGYRGDDSLSSSNSRILTAAETSRLPQCSITAISA